jgi:hypothetical protein
MPKHDADTEDQRARRDRALSWMRQKSGNPDLDEADAAAFLALFDQIDAPGTSPTIRAARADSFLGFIDGKARANGPTSNADRAAYQAAWDERFAAANEKWARGEEETFEEIKREFPMPRGPFGPTDVFSGGLPGSGKRR